MSRAASHRDRIFVFGTDERFIWRGGRTRSLGSVTGAQRLSFAVVPLSGFPRPNLGDCVLRQTFKGIIDILAWQTQRCVELETARSGHVVNVRLEQVVEMAFDGCCARGGIRGLVGVRAACSAAETIRLLIKFNPQRPLRRFRPRSKRGDCRTLR